MGANKQLSRWAEYFEELQLIHQISPQQRKTCQLIVASPPGKKSGRPSNS